MKHTIYRFILCAIVAAMLFAGIHASADKFEQDGQIMLCDLDYREVLD